MANWDRLRGKFNWVKSTRGKVLNLNYCNSRGSRFRIYILLDGGNEDYLSSPDDQSVNTDVEDKSVLKR